MYLREWAHYFGQCIGDCVPITRHVLDSRHVVPGSVFYAIRGARVDGHDYLRDAGAGGAIAAVVDKNYRGDTFGMYLLPVDDLCSALQLAAKRYLATISLKKLIGVTGSVGKTTTKEFVSEVLAESFRVFRSPKSYNSQLTVPLNILHTPRDTEILVLEMSMSRRGHIECLVDMAPVNIAIITPISYAHSAQFDDLLGISSAKAEILSSLQLEKIFVHETSATLQPIQEKLYVPYACYGKQHARRSSPFVYPFSATHLVEDAYVATLVARDLGMDDVAIQKGLDKLRPCTRRFVVTQWKGVTFIDDSYNASPASMKAGLENIPLANKNGRRIGVIGSMLDLGKFEEESHRNFGEDAVQTFDELLCIGKPCQMIVELFHKKEKKAKMFTTTSALRSHLLQDIREGDVVFVKGSNAHQLWEVIDFL